MVAELQNSVGEAALIGHQSASNKGHLERLSKLKNAWLSCLHVV